MFISFCIWLLTIYVWHIIIPPINAGPICASCNRIQNPYLCHHHIECPPSEKCYNRRYLTDSGANFYELGCSSIQSCAFSLEAIVGKRDLDKANVGKCDLDQALVEKRDMGPHIKCLSCCNSTLCNQNFVCGGSLLLNVTTGQICASCSGVAYPGDCNNHTTCFADEKCYVHRYATSSGRDAFDLGCIASQLCPLSRESETILGKRAEGQHSKCLDCCNDERLCNKYHTCGGIQNQTATLLQNTVTAIMLTPASPVTNAVPARDCSKANFRHNGVYNICPSGVCNSTVPTYCVLESGGVWTVIQRRFDGSVNFFRNWTSYKDGFGSASGEYWIGNDVIHKITSYRRYALKIWMKRADGYTLHAHYNIFRVADEANGYRLTINGFSGNATDEMSFLNGRKFSTYDHDNDRYTCNAAFTYQQGWWFNSCTEGGLNGHYNKIPSIFNGAGTTWYGQARLIQTMMMIKNY